MHLKEIRYKISLTEIFDYLVNLCEKINFASATTATTV
jgi:hypothetical protein